MYYLGIDTSNYTTSAAVLDSEGKLVWERRRLLKVPRGQRGLRQSEAFFQHVRKFPDIFQVPAGLSGKLSGVAVSTRPRDVESSYMPVFVAGTSFAQVISQALGIPLLECSHQQNHLAAGLWSTGWWPQEKFLALHLSGGTSEILEVEWDKSFKIKLLGESKDINAGQFIDRVGVALGLDFPAGPQLETLAAGARGEVRLASSVHQMDMSFSGPLSAALRLAGSVDPGELARGVEDCIAKAVEKALLRAAQVSGCKQVFFVGGVMSNARLRQRLSRRLEHKGVGLKLHFATPAASRDSAIGCAVLAWRKFSRG